MLPQAVSDWCRLRLSCSPIEDSIGPLHETSLNGQT
jgi:hypothetical protein